MSNSRYIVGIDLGTTNCALCYLDTRRPPAERIVETLRIPQLSAPGEVEELLLLPSFVYLPETHEVAPGSLELPWTDGGRDFAVGAFARDLAGKTPAKVVSSAKSWLCIEGVDRREPILPWAREAVPRRISPVRTQQLLLEHLCAAWDARMAADCPELRLANQDVLLTVPASFDAVARELTVEAANAAGLRVRLLEEPQAAFYAWLHDQGEQWRQHVGEGDIILVCDVGGGTTDFTLIVVTEEDGALGLQRIAVGEHILLGGDNMDLTLAYALAAKLQRERGVRLDAYQLAALTHACRGAKEKLSEGGGAQGAQTLTILGRGSGVVGGSLSVELTAAEMDALLIDGFFPRCGLDEKPAERRKVGLRAFGLEYASDPGVTRHVAGFLDQHSFRDAEGRALLPAAVLFNGGVTKSAVLRQRIVDILGEWGTATGQRPEILVEADPDLAVATGAAWYGTVQREGGLRIKAGSARSYYIGIESCLPAVPGFAPPVDALCVVPFGMEEGSSATIPAQGLGLVVGEPTEFRFFSSTVRPDDQIGEVLDDGAREGVTELPPLVAELPLEDSGGGPQGTLVPVELETVLTEVGTLQLWCRDTRGEGRWKLEFEIRGE
jgi:molecular chaperone DnaK (HSP70)